jgi:hypothetical protein
MEELINLVEKVVLEYDKWANQEQIRMLVDYLNEQPKAAKAAGCGY